MSHDRGTDDPIEDVSGEMIYRLDAKAGQFLLCGYGGGVV